MAHFLWGNISDNHKYHLVNWELMSQKKEFGGLGVSNLREFNLSLLVSWAKRYFAGGDKNWLTVVDHKYNNCSPYVLWSRRGVGSPFLKGATWDFDAIKPFYTNPWFL